jgi:hypothetical protein
MVRMGNMRNQTHTGFGGSRAALGAICEGFGEWMTQVQNFTFWDYASIGATGIAIPIAAWVLGFCILWAADGFRSVQNPK